LASEGGEMVACSMIHPAPAASTISELTVLGRPAILVPLPGALDADQKNNASLMADANAGWIMEQATISPPSLANRLTSLFGDPATLTAAAAAAKSLGQPKAVEQLADLAEAAAGRGKTT
jgi:UDP-N-acetylglucosamine--N-acetylmuramyl-(pentapeptide) pyrophosphoryl-undecaprenol N-acetylglucosamine transferase